VARDPARLVEVGRVVEVLAALAGPGRPAEVVDRDRGNATLGVSQRQLLEERMKPTHVRQDHDSRARGLLGPGEERLALGAVGALQENRPGINGGTADRVDRRAAVMSGAHAWIMRRPALQCRRRHERARIRRSV
jgi:hypothetical protein